VIRPARGSGSAPLRLAFEPPLNAYGLNMGHQLAVENRMHRKSGGLVAELELLRAKVQAELHVGAGHRQNGTARELADDGAVQVAGDDPAHLSVSRDHLPQCLPISVGET
jgi:hypothetical protein